MRTPYFTHCKPGRTKSLLPFGVSRYKCNVGARHFFSSLPDGVGLMNCGAMRLVSRRQILQAGAIGYLGLSLPRLLRTGREGHVVCRRVHPHFSGRRAQSSRYVGYEARCSEGNSRRVQANCHYGSRNPTLRTYAANGPDHAPGDNLALGSSQREQRPCRGRLHGVDRSRSRRDWRRDQADR